MKIYIKDMVSIRCKNAVKSVLEELGLHYGVVDLGEANIIENITDEQREQIRKGLLKHGLKLMDDNKAILIEKIKNIVVDMVHYSDGERMKINFSDYLAEKLGYNYTYLANIFATATGTNIEHFILLHKIERAKELIIYDELTISEIAYKLNFSNSSHLCYQFKKITGLTTTFFKQLKIQKRTELENLTENG